MRHGFLLLMVGAGTVAAAGACGGKVVFDGNGSGSGNGGHGGLGGQGGTSVVSSHVATTGVIIGPSASVGPSEVSVGVGPSCTCGQFCADVIPCGGSANQCMGFCANAPQNIIDCVCKAGSNCLEIKNCFGAGPGTGPGPTTAVSVGAGGGPPSQACTDCVNMSVNAACQGPVSTCLMDPACSQMIMCHQQCGWTQACKQQCDVGPPMGVADFDTLMSCLLCKDCGMPCAGSEIFNEYCTFPP